MSRLQNPNLEILKQAVVRLGELSEQMVFVGGCATGLLITDKAAPPIRVTRDVDAIVQVASVAAYYQLAGKLRKKGFSEYLSDGAPLCRWVTEDVILDIMPTDEKILGFSNQWYELAMQHSMEINLDSKQKIRMASASYFLVTKLTAFDGRGNNDYLLSHDIEDMIAVIDGRTQIVSEVERSVPELVNALSARFERLLKDVKFMAAVAGHLPSDQASQARLPLVFKAMQNIA